MPFPFSSHAQAPAAQEQLLEASAKFNQLLLSVLKRSKNVTPQLRGGVLMAAVKAINLAQIPGADTALWEVLIAALRATYAEEMERAKLGSMDTTGTLRAGGRGRGAEAEREDDYALMVPRCVRLLAFKARALQLHEGARLQLTELVRGMLAAGPVSEELRIARDAVAALEKEMPGIHGAALEYAMQLDDVIEDRSSSAAQREEIFAPDLEPLDVLDAGAASREKVARGVSVGGDVRLEFVATKRARCSTRLRIDLWSFASVPLRDCVLNLAPYPTAEALLHAIQIKELAPNQRSMVILDVRSLDLLDSVTFTPRLTFVYPGASGRDGGPRAGFDLPACTLVWGGAAGDDDDDPEAMGDGAGGDGGGGSEGGTPRPA